MTAFDRLRDLLRALNDEKVDYVLFGGQAVNLHGIPRFTEDIDLFVSPMAENVARLRQALHRLWSDPAIEEIQASDLAGDYAVIRYGTPDGFHVDLVSRIGRRSDSRMSRARCKSSAAYRCALRRHECCTA